MSRAARERPTSVTIVLPCRNEAAFIANCLSSVLANDYPAALVEILVVDGLSTDGTRATVSALAARDRRVRLLDNPLGIIPAAMNIGIAAARGDVILKVDAHARYPSDYVSQCVALLETSGADNVGGVLVTEPVTDTLTAAAIAAVLAHPFGSGNSRFRIGGLSEPVEADTAAFGCYRRSVFERVGLYNEHLVRSSDMDLNTRLRNAGGRILVSPTIVAWYYPRARFRDFALRNVLDGYWALYPWRWGSRLARPRHMAPLGALLLFVLIAALMPGVVIARWLIAWLMLAYAALCGAVAVQIAARERRPGLIVTVPVAILIRHVCYAVGSLCGAIRALMSKELRARLWRSDQTLSEHST